MYKEINEKKAKYEHQIILGYVITGIAFISYIPLGMAIGPVAFVLIAFPFLGGAFYAGYYSKKIKKISNDFKKVYVTQEMKKIFPDSSYYYDRGFSEDEVIASGLLFKRDRYHSEDMIRGMFENVSFRCSDVLQREVHSNGKTTTTVTVFQGRFYEFDFPKIFRNNLLLLQPMQFRPFSKFHKIKMESIEFNSSLKVYAEDDHEAFYILTPQLMERLIQMDRKYFNKITFSFLNHRLYIAIDSRIDYFDIKPFKTVDESILQEYQEELRDIKDFILELQLNETLFK
ncbi:MAG: DUF3137 domain-containing protein [Bacilli bacterium]|nr:DUF3137 domain-containing protein [Bacilli bacterium]MBN2876311.1 DUF3137 domain-containing protein [Bacilli bacterium]